MPQCQRPSWLPTVVFTCFPLTFPHPTHIRHSEPKVKAHKSSPDGVVLAHRPASACRARPQKWFGSGEKAAQSHTSIQTLGAHASRNEFWSLEEKTVNDQQYERLESATLDKIITMEFTPPTLVKIRWNHYVCAPTPLRPWPELSLHPQPEPKARPPQEPKQRLPRTCEGKKTRSRFPCWATQESRCIAGSMICPFKSLAQVLVLEVSVGPRCSKGKISFFVGRWQVVAQNTFRQEDLSSHLLSGASKSKHNPANVKPSKMLNNFLRARPQPSDSAKRTSPRLRLLRRPVRCPLGCSSPSSLWGACRLA